MKKSKIIIPALAMLVMSTAATVSGTVAWFSMNKIVTAEGMKITAQGDGSIVITKYVNNANVGYGLPKHTDRTSGVDFGESNATAHAFYPSTHDITRATGLKYVTNGDKINPETGTAINGTSNLLSFDVANGDTFFYDYNVYIAGNGQAFEDETLTISLLDVTDWTDSAAHPNHNALPNVMKAVSIDFYGAAFSSDHPVAEINSTNWIGTLNLAGEHNLTEKTKEAQTSISKVVTIPQAVTNAGKGTAGFSVRMRAFFDGALIDNAGAQAYTVLDDCGASETVANYTGNGHQERFLYNAEGYVMAELSTMQSSDSVAGYKYVNYTDSTSTYARTADILDVEDIGLKVTFTLGA